eukprot:CAMPEP_0169273338 /NCGR_PEP_ID=MMETSP1016-20121227/51043_1 /TAXON_ID=342587 /ORGANISM="Karlodinium micrum, Strain CCMP2283" /LENGTH=137 /DNA_ID=CAMNT_0009359635 /DNA_START=126 /DNA_END=536 /DNA_ORIENTATION=+
MTSNGYASVMKALVDNLEELEGNASDADLAILLQRCAQEHQSAAALHFNIEFQTQQAALAKHEARASQLQEVLQDLASSEMAMKVNLSEEQLHAVEYKKRLTAIESLDDPWDRSRAIVDAGSEIRTLMQEQELAANV